MYRCIIFVLFTSVCALDISLRDCLNSTASFNCFCDKTAEAIQKAASLDIPLFAGVKLVRDENITNVEERSQTTGFSRVLNALSNIFRTHSLFVDFTEGRQLKDEEENKVEENTKAGGGGGFGIGKKQLRRERKYLQYAFMVLLGIFGLTGPLFMKTLAIMAAKSLIASKVALIIVGSVALRKIFEKEEKGVKVHTIHADDDHDRVYNTQKVQYWAYHKPQYEP